MSGILTNHPHNTFATHNLAIFAYALYRTSNFHLSHLLVVGAIRTRYTLNDAELFDLYSNHTETFQP